MVNLTLIDDRKELARKYALKYLLDTVLICAIAERESSWNPYAVRFEPAFYKRYVQQMTLNDTEEYTRSMSWGLMQVMGETAREFGFKGEFLVELSDPDTGLDYGCKKLRRCMDIHLGDEDAALLAYNGGSEPMYPKLVQNLKPKYY